MKRHFDAVTFRALTTMDPTLVRLLLQVAPQIIAYKGRRDVVMLEKQLLEEAGYRCRVEELESLYLKRSDIYLL